MLSPDIKQAVEEKAQELVGKKSEILGQKLVAVSGLLFSALLTLIGSVSAVVSPEDARPAGMILGTLGAFMTTGFALVLIKLIPMKERQAEDDFAKGMEMQQHLEALERRLEITSPQNLSSL